MKITLQRTSEDAIATLGGLNFDGMSRPIYTLEPPRYFNGQENVPNQTCIPAGLYAIGKHDSPAFLRLMPILLNVPGRSEILIHAGNTAHNTEGCLLCAYGSGADDLLNSRPAADEVRAAIFAAIDSGEGASIEIIEIPPDSPAVA